MWSLVGWATLVGGPHSVVNCQCTLDLMSHVCLKDRREVGKKWWINRTKMRYIEFTMDFFLIGENEIENFLATEFILIVIE